MLSGFFEFNQFGSVTPNHVLVGLSGFMSLSERTRSNNTGIDGAGIADRTTPIRRVMDALLVVLKEREHASSNK